MEIKISESINRVDYEILIRKRGYSDYASYCPQINLMLKGTQHEDVATEMEKAVESHIESILQEKSIAEDNS